MKILVLCLFLSSCSTLKRTLTYSALDGGTAGAGTGVLISPNRTSDVPNAVLFGAIGAGLSVLIAYLVYGDDPRNYRLNNMLLMDRGDHRGTLK